MGFDPLDADKWDTVKHADLLAKQVCIRAVWRRTDYTIHRATDRCHYLITQFDSPYEIPSLN